MNFDFHREYARYTNADLLRIVLQPDKYRQEAVIAAREILATRSVTEQEQLQAQEALTPPQEQQSKPHTIDDRWQTEEGIFGTSGIPDFSYQRIWPIPAIIMVFLAALNLYTQVKALARHTPYMDAYINLAVFVPQVAGLCFYLMRKRPGWILPISWLCYLVLTKVVSFVIMIYYLYRSAPLAAPPAFYQLIAELALTITCILLLCRADTRAVYTISKEQMTRTITVSTAVTILYCITVVAIYYLRAAS